MNKINFEENKRFKLLQGDSIEVLKSLPDESINCVMTSPPYWALRSYLSDEHDDKEKELGTEKNFNEYIMKLCDVFDEVKRVLRKDGTCWVNIGDTYGGSGNSSGHTIETKNLGYTTSMMGASKGNQKSTKGYEKCLLQIPSRFSIEMQNRGWILRNVIVWKKNNCMPSPIKDRFTIDFEYIFFFVKNQKYFFETQYEPLSQESLKNTRFNTGPSEGIGKTQTGEYAMQKAGYINSIGRIKRAVWTINPQPYKEAHFAVYPLELCETPIRAGCPEFICNKCGVPRKKVYEKVGIKNVGSFGGVKHVEGDSNINPLYSGNTEVFIWEEKDISDCGCNEGFYNGVVLDPFTGSSTTGVVALQQNKKFIGIDLNKEYLELSRKRLEETDVVVEDNKKQKGVFDYE